MAVIRFYGGSPESYQVEFTAWVVVVRPERCAHCGAEQTYIFWGSYLRWVRFTTHRLHIRIERVRCTVCRVTDAILPSFLHIFRHYALSLIQQAITLAIEGGLWGDALANAVGPYNQPAFSTVHEWVWSFVLSAVWLLPWLQRALLALDPQASLDPGRPPKHLLGIQNARRQTAFLQGWQVLQLAQVLYATTRAQQPNLAFQATMLLAFLAVALGAAGRMPRLLWPNGVVPSAIRPTQSGRQPQRATNPARPP